MTTLFASVPGSAAGLVPQWRLDSLQVINWGSFEGQWTVDLADTSTLVTGASGAGKSTLLDAYTALLMDGTTPFNSASKEGVGGKARGDDNRNVLAYMRGKHATTRDAATGTTVAKVMRGEAEPTWSALAATWCSTSGRQFTALRLFYAPTSARAYRDVTAVMATFPGAFDAGAVEPLAADRFPAKALKERFPGWQSHATYQAFMAAVCSEVGIGTPGQHDKALKLLHRIQGGGSFTSVDALYKSLVLDSAETINAAAAAVDHFATLDEAYQAMVTAQNKERRLAPITPLRAERDTAQHDVGVIDRLQSDHPTSPPSTPFQLWDARRRAAAAAAAVHTHTDQLPELVAAELSAKGLADGLEVQERDLRRQAEQEGGDVVARLEGDIEELSRTRKKRRVRRDALVAVAAVHGPIPDSEQDYVAAVQRAEQALNEAETRREQLLTRVQQLGARQHPHTERVKHLQAEIASLQDRDGRIPRDLHEARVDAAGLLGVAADRLPFVAELIDMTAGHEQWRKAAELALGGFATTMLVDRTHLPALRAAINSQKWPRRVRFEGVPTGQPLQPPPTDPALLPARLVIKTSPFAGWLSARLQDRFDFRCVDDVAALQLTSRGLTVTGQTAESRRGAHGGNTSPAILGFSNVDRVKELQDELATAQRTLEQLQHERQQLAADGDDRVQRRGWEALRNTAWSDIDVAELDHRINELQRRYDALTGENSTYTELREQLDELESKLDETRRLRYAAQDRRVDAEKDLEEATQARDHAAAEAVEIVDRGGQLDDDQDSLLAELLTHHGAVSDDETVTRIRAALRTRRSQAAGMVDRTGTQLSSIFSDYREQWGESNLGVDPDDSFDGYADILSDLMHHGLGESTGRFLAAMTEWSSSDLVPLQFAYRQTREEFDERRHAVNDILHGLPFGPHKHRLAIELHDHVPDDVARFKNELRTLASGVAGITSDADTAVDRYRDLSALMDRLRGPERDRFLDVTRHVFVEAQVRDEAGAVHNVIHSINSQSGGESQESLAFILGAALRYQLGDLDTNVPRYACVVLDEGFVKADEAFTGRSVQAWLGLGFQLLIAAPPEKTNSLEPYTDRVYQVLKNDHGQATLALLQPLQPSAQVL